MTEQEWFDYANKHRDRIARLIRSFHPAANRVPPELASVEADMPITAPDTERARQNVVRSLQHNYNSEYDPVVHFDGALNARSVDDVYTVLNATWFGVPESTSCWQLDGFAEVVTLLENVYEDDNDDDDR